MILYLPITKAFVKGHYRTNPKTKESYWVEDYYDKRKLKRVDAITPKQKKRVNKSEQELTHKKKQLESELAYLDIHESEAIHSHGSKFKKGKLRGKDYYAGHSIDEVRDNFRIQRTKIENEMKQIEADLGVVGKKKEKAKPPVKASQQKDTPTDDKKSKMLDMIKSEMQKIGIDSLVSKDPPVTVAPPYSFSFSSRQKVDGYKVGDVIKSKEKDLKGKPRFVTITSAERPFYTHEGLSMGYIDDDAWIYSASGRASTKEEIESYLKSSGVSELDKIKKDRLNILATNFRYISTDTNFNPRKNVFPSGNEIKIGMDRMFVINNGGIYMVDYHDQYHPQVYRADYSEELVNLIKEPIKPEEISYTPQEINIPDQADIDRLENEKKEKRLNQLIKDGDIIELSNSANSKVYNISGGRSRAVFGDKDLMQSSSDRVFASSEGFYIVDNDYFAVTKNDQGKLTKEKMSKEQVRALAHYFSNGLSESIKKWKGTRFSDVSIPNNETKTTLPPLEGTPKQISWANDIRNGMIKFIENKIKEQAPYTDDKMYDDESVAEAKKMIKELEKNLKTVKTKKSAKWFIDNR